MAHDAESRILMRVGATLPALEVTLTDENGRPVDLSAATGVQVVVVDWKGTELWRNAATPAPDQVAGRGQVTYAWRTADTATAGNYGLYLEAAWTSGGVSDFPTDGPLDFTVAEPSTSDLDPFVVSPDRVARRIGVPLPLTDELRQVLEDMIADVQADVEGYLRRPIVPTRFTETASRDYTDPVGWRLAWDPVVKVLAAADNGDGTGTVSYVAGITNAVAQRAITRYVTGAAMEEFRAHPKYGKDYRSVRSLSAGGRSVTYDQPAGTQRRSMAQLPAYPQPGSMPSIETLAAWRRRGTFSRMRYAGQGASAGGGIIAPGVYVIGAGQVAPADALFARNATTGEVTPL